MLRYLQSEMKSRLVELEGLEGLNTDLEDQINRYSGAISEDEITLDLARQVVEHYSVNIDFIRSHNKPAPLQELGPDFGARQPASKEDASYLSGEISESMLEFENLLTSEEKRLQNARLRMRQITDRLSLQRLQHSLAANKKSQIQNAIKIVNDNIHNIACLMRPQTRIPGEVWADIFAYHIHNGLIEYIRTSRESFFIPTTFTLSQVCSRWRHIVHDQASLWSYIGFHLERNWKKHRMEAFRFVLEKTQGHEITFIATTPPLSTTSSSAGTVDITSIDGIRKSNYGFYFRLKRHNIDIQARCSELGFDVPNEVRTYPSILSRGKDIILSGKLPRSPIITCVGMVPHSSILDSVGLLHLVLLPVAGENIDVTPYLIQNLSSLAITSHRFYRPFNTGETITLPKLKALRITATHEDIMKYVETPSLRNLLLDPPRVCSEEPEDDYSATSLLRLASTCSVVMFCNWIQPSDEDSTKLCHSASSLCLELVKGSPRLTQLGFSNSWINGEQFASSLEVLLGDSKRTAKSIEKLMLYHCTGITRMDCDKLAELVGRLEVFV
ncbi:hypothetical protein FRB91_003920 [Serendipita sp. 411]|nr:hypothetical protein FRC18_000740 [Serendipita sp. 400]KAG8823661.1 hypothetical protein FRC19_003371 [Serendipita sp. 401]KAG8842791.1 hypothetical protein FRB91_003920 [Serendipita sp. 411]KAG9041813.1 hypothetical protein FS842_002435 [Serendipita sp. 407]